VVLLGLAGSSELSGTAWIPKMLWIPRCEVADLAGGDAALNALIFAMCLVAHVALLRMRS